MKSKLLSIALSAMLIQPALAAVHTPKPEVCPTTSALFSAGVTQAELTTYGWMAYNLKNHFGTKDEWSFLMFGLVAEDEADAIDKYNAAIPSLTLSDGPTKSDEDGKEVWGCVYTDIKENATVMGITVTPPVEPFSMLRFKR